MNKSEHAKPDTAIRRSERGTFSYRQASLTLADAVGVPGVR